MNPASVVPKVLPFHVLEEITDDFSEERTLGCGAYGKVYLGVHQNGEMVAVKLLHPTPELDDEQFKTEFNHLASLQHQNIVRLVGYCHETRRQFVQHNGNMVLVDVTHRALCFEYMHKGSLDKYLSDNNEYNGHDWDTRYAIIKGICEGLKYLHEELDSPIYHLDLKPANILLDENLVPKIADFGLSRLFWDEQTRITKNLIGTRGYMPPEFIDAGVISNKFDIFSLGAVILKMIAGPKGHSESAEMSSQQFIELVHGNWMNELQMQSCSEQVKRCTEIALRCVEFDRSRRPRSIGEIVNKLNEIETLTNDLGSSMDQMTPCITSSTPLQLTQAKQVHTETPWLDVYPLQVHFNFFEPNKFTSRPLRVTNNTDDNIAFRCLPKPQENYAQGLLEVRAGIVPPRSAHIYFVRMGNQPPPNMDALDVVLQSCVAHADIVDVEDNFLTEVREQMGGEVQEVTLVVTFDTAGGMSTSEIICHINHRGTFVVCMDVHPTKPWILAGHNDGYISLWNYETQERVMALRIVEDTLVRSTRFIPREQWFLAGDGHGCIHVRSCDTSNEVKKFQAHTSWVQSLSVHPSLPLLLSASWDMLIKLWDWEQVWMCLRVFKGHTDYLETVVFNPQNDSAGNVTFASVSLDGTAKIWRTTFPIPINTFDYRPNEVMCVDYFSPTGDGQYMVAGSSAGDARVWDLKTRKCIRQIEGLQTGHGNNIGVVDCSPDHPLLVTALDDHSIGLCNSTTYRYEKVYVCNLGRIRSFVYIKGIRSVAVGCEGGLAILEI